MAIERAYGQLKRRFPMLQFGIRLEDVEDSANLVVAAVILFNFCKIHDDEDFDGPEFVENQDQALAEPMEDDAEIGRIEGEVKRNSIKDM